MSDTVIRHPLPCSRCGYDLEGLSARGRCPECGHAVVESLATQVDIEAPTLAPMPALRRTSAAILLVALGALGGTGPFLASLTARATAALSLDPRIATSAIAAGSVGAAAATLLAALGMIAVLPWSRDGRLVRPRALGAFGFLLWFALVQFAGETVPAARQASIPWTIPALTVPLLLVLLALAPLLDLLGPRCLAYRNARATAQRIDGLVVATAIAGGTGFAALILAGGDFGPESVAQDIATLLAIVATAAGALTVVGLVYLVLNAVWIVRSSGHPLLTVEEAFGGREQQNKRC